MLRTVIFNLCSEYLVFSTSTKPPSSKLYPALNSPNNHRDESRLTDAGEAATWVVFTSDTPGDGASPQYVRRKNPNSAAEKRDFSLVFFLHVHTPGALRIHLQDVLEAAGQALLLPEGLADAEVKRREALVHHAPPEGPHADLLPHRHGYLRVHETRRFPLGHGGGCVALATGAACFGGEEGGEKVRGRVLVVSKILSFLQFILLFFLTVPFFGGSLTFFVFCFLQFIQPLFLTVRYLFLAVRRPFFFFFVFPYCCILFVGVFFFFACLNSFFGDGGLHGGGGGGWLVVKFFRTGGALTLHD